MDKPEIDKFALEVSQHSPYSYELVKEVIDGLRDLNFDFSRYTVDQVAQNLLSWSWAISIARSMK
jgi:hypothetical protein